MKTQRQLLANILCALLLSFPLPTRAADNLISLVDFWLYLDSGVDQGTAWKGVGFDDFAWNIGISEFGFGEGDEFTELNSSPNGPLNTAYFRTYFGVANANSYSNLTLRLLRDDGAVVYINGIEVFRNNMPAGAINYATKAFRNLDGADELQLAQRVLPASVLVSGQNVIAVETHQAVGGGDDMSFAVELIGHRVGENQPPSASSSFITVEQDQSITFALNASDPDGNPLTFTVLSAPVHGSLSGSGPNVTYTAEPGYVGPDLFSFQATDGQWTTEVAEVGIEVTLASNHPPVADAQNLTVAEDNALTVVLTATDPDGDPLGYAYTQTLHGTLTAGPGHSVIYQPAPNYFGPDSFTFTVDDGHGAVASATINITVLSVNDAPVALAREASAADPDNLTRNLVLVSLNNQNAPVLLDASGSSDVDGNALSYAWYRGTEPVPFSTAMNPSVSFPIGSYVLTLVVSDGTASASDSVTLQVLTPGDVVKVLLTELQAAALPSSVRNGLLGHLNAALSAFSNGNIAAGVHQLELFQARVDNKLAPTNPTLAQDLNNRAQEIINEVTGQ